MKVLAAAAMWLLGTALVAQAPVVRRPPPMNGPQAPASDDAQEHQTPVAHEGTIHVQSHLVNVAVNVVDQTGAPVGGLGRDDFEIFEDNQPQKIAVFEKNSATPLEIVLAIDASLSVFGDERLERNAAKHFVNALLRPEDELDLMDFADTVREIVPFTSDKRRIERGLGELQHGDETALYDAVYLAADRLATTRQDNGQRRVMVLITDGVDTAKGTSYPRAVEQAQRAGAMVYSIIVVPVEADAGRNTGGEHALIQMAADTGGKYYYVEDPRGLEPAFAHVSDDLRTQYMLGYYAPQQTDAGTFHRIGVRLKDPALRTKYQLRYRTGYYGSVR
ncbi:VWA domain-containing protein [Edaphobacter sp.]|uniref:VWA domain-containing protein n=1 Tax=Edaphobacter sp. TaxID=1934404 RepID=UPI002DB79866|nr:VWA domain-containing protein [Edaphobacter sp.]HEU5341661.1 VWA domain-containing protein [Edaphobacter sp.]